jgi:uncharacterized protein YdeI (YjbR/CyaY-like superfamily)
MNTKVDLFIRKAKKWQEELTQLRNLLLQTELKEDYKWMHPCYTLNNKNVIIIHGFKEYCALLFFKGALLKDPNNMLIKQTEHVQSARQIRFTQLQDIAKIKSILKAYIQEAIEVEKAGLKVTFKTTQELIIPEEFQQKLNEMKALKKAFVALTSGRQRGYIHYFSNAKQSKTRVSRIEKWIPQILQGKGLDD